MNRGPMGLSHPRANTARNAAPVWLALIFTRASGVLPATTAPPRIANARAAVCETVAP